MTCDRLRLGRRRSASRTAAGWTAAPAAGSGSRRTQLPTRTRRPHRRLHQDREAGRRRRLDRRDAGDPEPRASADRIRKARSARDPTPNAVIRSSGCATTAMRRWHLHLRQQPEPARLLAEHALRPARRQLPSAATHWLATTSPMMLGGVISYVALDANNLKRWFAGHDRHDRQRALEQQRLHRLLLRPPGRSQRERRRRRQPRDGRVRVRGLRQSRRRDRPTNSRRRCKAARTSTRTAVLDRYGETPHHLTVRSAAVTWVGTGFELPFGPRNFCAASGPGPRSPRRAPRRRA